MQLTGGAVAIAHPTLIQKATEAAIAAPIQHCAVAAPAAKRQNRHLLCSDRNPRRERLTVPQASRWLLQAERGTEGGRGGLPFTAVNMMPCCAVLA